MNRPLSWLGQGPSAAIESPHRYAGTYQQYLRSPYWRAIRRRALIAASWVCQQCYRSQREDVILEVHHLTYDRLGCEVPGDLKVLCGDCHKAAHGLAEDPA